MHSTTPVLKDRPEDFVVREAVAVELVHESSAQWEYLVLRKSGYTTFEAVGLLAEALHVGREQVTYAGLKDEDGITEQLVGIPIGVGGAGSDWRMAEADGRWLTVQRHGFGTRPLTIGGLAGNAFRIVVRNLDTEYARIAEQRRKVTAFVLNYYDTQRFGVPGGPKRTHFVGEALLAEDWDTALKELIGLRAPESDQAAEFTGSAKDFFHRLDPRVSSFQLAAHASHEWNATLRGLVDDTCVDSGYQVSFDGIDYLWTHSPTDAARVLAGDVTLPYTRYWFTPDGIRATRSSRPTVVQTVMEVSDVGTDESHPGRARLTMTFFLPSGSYATSAVRQVLGYRWAEGSR
jgi:tRNA pseudouridine13 synthase